GEEKERCRSEMPPNSRIDLCAAHLRRQHLMRAFELPDAPRRFKLDSAVHLGFPLAAIREMNGNFDDPIAEPGRHIGRLHLKDKTIGASAIQIEADQGLPSPQPEAGGGIVN